MRACRLTASRSNASSRIRISHDARGSRAGARIGRDCAPRLRRRSTGVPRATASSPARRARARGTRRARARLEQRRAAEERHAVLAERGRRPRHGLAVEVRRGRSRRRPPDRTAAARRRPAEGGRRDLGRDELVLVARGPPHLDVRRRLPRRRLGEHHPDRERLVVVDEAEREQPVDEVGRRRRRARPPTCRRCGRAPGACAWISARTSSTSSARGGTAAPRSTPGWSPRAHPEHVAVGRRSARRPGRAACTCSRSRRASRIRSALRYELRVPAPRGRRAAGARPARRTRASRRTGSPCPRRASGRRSPAPRCTPRAPAAACRTWRTGRGGTSCRSGC